VKAKPKSYRMETKTIFTEKMNAGFEWPRSKQEQRFIDNRHNMRRKKEERRDEK